LEVRRSYCHNPRCKRRTCAEQLAKARVCGIDAVETFATGLEVDGATVRAALTES